MMGKVFENGEWVRGRSLKGELLHGYVEMVDLAQGINKVTVIESDNKKLIGKTIWIADKFVEKLPSGPANTENELLSLIDLALLNRDEQWFMELSEKLTSIKKISNDKRKKSTILFSRNRVGNIDSKQ